MGALRMGMPRVVMHRCVEGIKVGGGLGKYVRIETSFGYGLGALRMGVRGGVMRRYDVRIETSLGYGMGALRMSVTGGVMHRCVEGFKVWGRLGRRDK
uniref:Uncharacterized protein n=1 Tax=Solanum lycopersicum TaxID=4081 RepID=K4AV58_SOLLC